jgi:RnfABCDGE-type electron transport complex B subunit
LPKETKKLAIIDAENCIGCHVCVRECPFDAILGANETLHQVINDLCTGCELCIDPCPTNCISLIEVESTHTQFHPKKISYVLAQIQRPKSKDNFKNTVSEDNHILMLELINKAKKKYEES